MVAVAAAEGGGVTLCGGGEFRCGGNAAKSQGVLLGDLWKRFVLDLEP